MSAQPQWTPQDIALALAAKGWTLRRLADEVGLSPSGASYALKSGSSLPLRAKVEEILQTSWTTLWPDRCPPQWRDCGPP
jgi:lambda repressor-like predicted transcriptional regulator